MRGRLAVVGVCIGFSGLVGAAAATAISDGPAAVRGDAAGKPATADFVGSWRLISFEARSSDGEVRYPMGEDAGGLLIYTKSGQMSAAVWRAGRTPFAVNDQQKGTSEEYTAAMQSYIQLIGAFTVDGEAGTVSHHLEEAMFPNWSGTEQKRFYEFSDGGDRLTLKTPPIDFGDSKMVWTVRWARESAR